MIEHVTLHCTDVQSSRMFYEKALAPLGYRVNMEFEDSVGFMADGHTSFWIAKGKIGQSGHIAFRARNRKAVDAFYRTALEAGAKDNGPPGLRPYSPTYYAAFVFDRDGHNIEAVTFAKPPRRPAKKRTGKAPAKRRR